jgi:hypothetical protein
MTVSKYFKGGKNQNPVETVLIYNSRYPKPKQVDNGRKSLRFS